MNLKEILEEQAEYVKKSGYTVWIDEIHRYVSIDGKTESDGFFLQDHEADEYIREARRLWRDPAAMVGLDTCFEAMAKPYIESLI